MSFESVDNLNADIESNSESQTVNVSSANNGDKYNLRSKVFNNNIETLNVSRVENQKRIVLAAKNFPWDSFFIGFFAILGALVLWQLLAFYQVNMVVSFENIPTPLIVAEQFSHLLGTEEFYKHIGASLQRIGIAFSSASFFGVLIGIFMGRSKIFCGIMTPYIEILRPIPAGNLDVAD